MLINELIDLLNELPTTLAAGWASWLAAGLILSIWQRRERKRLVVHVATKRQKSAGRPPSGVRAPARVMKSVPMSSGDAFGELEALLEPPTGTHRMPGEPSQVLTDYSRSAVVLAAPQSLP